MHTQLLVLVGLWATLFPDASRAQSDGPNTGGQFASTTTASNSSVYSWSLQNNVVGSDNLYAVATVTGAGAQTTQLLVVTNFGLVVPEDGTVAGVEVEVERSSTATTCQTAAVHLVRYGAILESYNGSSGDVWPTSDAVITYGGPTDLWSAPLDRPSVQDASFGVAISALVNNGEARIDRVRMTVYYSLPPLPVTLSSFRAQARGGSVTAEWTTSAEIENDYFVLERSLDARTFEPVAEVRGAGTSHHLRTYAAVDEGAVPGRSYYRLKQVDFDGTTERFDPVAVWVAERPLLLSPSPWSGGPSPRLHGTDPAAVSTLRLFDGLGREAAEVAVRLGTVDVPQSLPPGLYHYVAYDAQGRHRGRGRWQVER
ncbi:MAG: hypothetical protein WBA12_09230 [Catalinimonas sp.]